MENGIQEQPKKSYVVTLLLALFFGALGVHRFYTGRVLSGIAQLLTMGGFGVWTFIDIIMLTLGKFKAANDQELDSYNKGCGLLVLAIMIMLFIFGGITTVLTMFTGKLF